MRTNRISDFRVGQRIYFYSWSGAMANDIITGIREDHIKLWYFPFPVYIDATTKLFFSEEDLVSHMKDIVPEEKIMKEKEIERLTAELKQAKDELEDLNRFLSYHKEA